MTEKVWFSDEKISVMEWPAMPPDLYSIGFPWGILARDVYRSARQFQTKAQLKKQVMRSWANTRPATSTIW